MKKLLFDFITLQDNIINGGMLYTQKIFKELLSTEVIIYGLYDGNIPFNERVKLIIEQYKILFININDKNLSEIINSFQIDTMFIGIAQRYNSFDLCDLKCRIVIVCHDLCDMSLFYSDILNSKKIKGFTQKYLKDNKKDIRYVIRCIFYPIVLLRRYIRQKNNLKNYYNNFLKLIKRSNVFIVTVSEYSKYCIQYFLGTTENEIKVFYPPLICENNNDEIADYSELSNLIKDKKYFLMLSANRINKNPNLIFEQWRKFCLYTNYEYYCVLIGKNLKTDIKNCIILNEVNINERNFLYKNAFALIYPSFAEGFGYPPIEAAAHNTPCICSNVTSIPEIYDDMPIYFSPFYPEDLFRALIKMTENREYYVEKTKKRYLEVYQKQKSDLEKLIDYIILDKAHDDLIIW